MIYQIPAKANFDMEIITWHEPLYTKPLLCYYVINYDHVNWNVCGHVHLDMIFIDRLFF